MAKISRRTSSSAATPPTTTTTAAATKTSTTTATPITTTTTARSATTAPASAINHGASMEFASSGGASRATRALGKSAALPIAEPHGNDDGDDDRTNDPLQRTALAAGASLVEAHASPAPSRPSPASPAPAALIGGGAATGGGGRSTNYTGAINETSRLATTATPYVTTDTRNLTEAEYERERIREEFFMTYDVMTGVRIAATLGGFFGLMVFLIVWKSRSSSNETLKVLKDPKMAAVAAVCMQEEEEREIQEAIVATGMSIYPDEYDALVYRRQRMLSLGNVSAPPMLHRGYRCSSMSGAPGYSYLLEPPRRFSYSAISAGGGAPSGSGSGHLASGNRRKSGSESSRIFSNYPMGGSFGTDDYFVETEDELEPEEYLQRDGTLHELDEEAQLHNRTDSTRSKQGFLSVPLAGHDSRRSSAMTCCSTDSSYLERRTSAYTLGMSNLPPTLQRKLSTASRTSSIENWDYYYPDIQVIQPTPKASPCPSERSIHEPSPAAVPKSKAQPIISGAAAPGMSMPCNIVRKHSIVSYDPDSAQAGRKQQIHSISADTVDVYPYNQALVAGSSSIIDLGLPLPKPIQSAPPTSAHQAFHFSDSPTEELRLGVRRKLTVMELQRSTTNSTAPESNNNSYPYTANAATANATAAPAAGTATAAPATSSSISIDSTPMSMDKLNGSISMGTVSGKALFNAEKRAPLASLSSFKISSLEYQDDSEMRSLEDEDSVFGLESPADTDDDMQQLSSDSGEESAAATACKAASTETAVTPTPSNVDKPPAVTAALRVQQQQQLAQQLAQPLRYIHGKRFSLSAVPSSAAGARPRRPLLQRHRTISASSSDRVSLIGQPLQEFQGSGSQTLVMTPLETHFGAIICTGNSNSPTQPRRAQLLQQFSDPQSLPTTTTTTTTTTTEEDTCSTLNTEVGLLDVLGTGAGAGGCESATHTQYSSLNTVISLGRSSPLTDNNYVCSSGSATNANNASICNPLTLQLQLQQPPPAASQAHITQLPLTRLAHDPCASSISDSVIATRPQSICMPSSLKEVIRGGNGNGNGGYSKSANNVGLLSTVSSNEEQQRSVANAMPAIMLELPLIKLPTEEEDVDDNIGDEGSPMHSSTEAAAAQSSQSKSDESESRDPSLPGTSRKWSKETLF